MHINKKCGCSVVIILSPVAQLEGIKWYESVRLRVSCLQSRVMTWCTHLDKNVHKTIPTITVEVPLDLFI